MILFVIMVLLFSLSVYYSVIDRFFCEVSFDFDYFHYGADKYVVAYCVATWSGDLKRFLFVGISEIEGVLKQIKNDSERSWNLLF